MSKNITQILKLVLVGFSLYLCYSQYLQNNITLVVYWIVVAIYWLFNFISGLPNKKEHE